MPAPLEPGTILIASLGLEDPNFTRAVVLLLQYVPEEVTLGVVINRPLGDKEELYPKEELSSFTHGLDDNEIRSNLFYQGGPVEPGSLIFLHRVEELSEDATPIVPGLFAGGDLDVLRARSTVAEGGDHPFLRFFLGYAEWAPGQLEAEIALGAWILSPSDVDLVFSDDPDSIWQRAMHSLGGKYAPMSYIPEDPSLN